MQSSNNLIACYFQSLTVSLGEKGIFEEGKFKKTVKRSNCKNSYGRFQELDLMRYVFRSNFSCYLFLSTIRTRWFLLFKKSVFSQFEFIITLYIYVHCYSNLFKKKKIEVKRGIENYFIATNLFLEKDFLSHNLKKNLKIEIFPRSILSKIDKSERKRRRSI